LAAHVAVALNEKDRARHTEPTPEVAQKPDDAAVLAALK